MCPLKLEVTMFYHKSFIFETGNIYDNLPFAQFHLAIKRTSGLSALNLMKICLLGIKMVLFAVMK